MCIGSSPGDGSIPSLVDVEKYWKCLEGACVEMLLDEGILSIPKTKTRANTRKKQRVRPKCTIC